MVSLLALAEVMHCELVSLRQPAQNVVEGEREGEEDLDYALEHLRREAIKN